MASRANSDWFLDFALTVREIVVTHGGAIAMTKQELQEAVTQQDSTFAQCPDVVFKHPTLPLGYRANLQASAFTGKMGDVLLIHLSSIPAAVARTRCRVDGLSEAVHIALMERSTA